MGVPVTKIFNPSLLTTDNTPVKTFAYDAVVDGVYEVVCKLIAFNETDGTGYIQQTYRGFTVVSGTLSALAAQANTFAYGGATVTLTIGLTGNEIYVELTGVTSKNIDWNVEVTLKYT